MDFNQNQFSYNNPKKQIQLLPFKFLHPSQKLTRLMNSLQFKFDTTIKKDLLIKSLKEPGQLSKILYKPSKNVSQSRKLIWLCAWASQGQMRRLLILWKFLSVKLTGSDIQSIILIKMKKVKINSLLIGIILIVVSEEAIFANFQSPGTSELGNKQRNFYFFVPDADVNSMSENQEPVKKLQTFAQNPSHNQPVKLGSQPQFIGEDQSFYSFGQSDIQVQPQSIRITIQMNPKKQQYQNPTVPQPKPSYKPPAPPAPTKPKINSTRIQTQTPITSTTIKYTPSTPTPPYKPQTSKIINIAPPAPLTLEQVPKIQQKQTLPTVTQSPYVNPVQNTVKPVQENIPAPAEQIQQIRAQPATTIAAAAQTNNNAAQQNASSSTSSQVPLTDAQLARRRSYELVAEILKRANTIPTRTEDPIVAMLAAGKSAQPSIPIAQQTTTQPQKQLQQSQQPEQQQPMTEDLIKQILAQARLEANPSLKQTTNNKPN